MVKYFQKPTPRHYCYSVWLVPDSTSKNTSLALLCQRQDKAQDSTQQEQHPQDVLDAALCQHPDVAHIRALYVPAVDLQHYGEVDHLAPAGAMAEFVQHVQGQAIEEAIEAFAPLQLCVQRHGLTLEISVAPNLKKAKNLLRDLNARAAD